jgi:hypothetical protein
MAEQADISSRLEMLASPTGDPPTACELALCQRERLAGLAALVEHANDVLAIGYAGHGIVRLLKDAANAAAELHEVIRAGGNHHV